MEFLSILALLFAVVGVAGCILPLLPGPILGYAGLLCAYGCSYSGLSATALVVWGAATLVAIVADYFLPACMTRLLGGSKAGEIGATIGMVAGIFFSFSIVAIILFPFAGAVIGEFIHDSSNSGRAFRSGFGSFLAFAVGTGLKLAVSIGMLIHIATDTWGPLRDWLSSLF